MAYNLKGDVAVERRMDTGILGIPEWRASTRYKAGDLMRVGTTYRVRKTDGTSGLTYDAAESVDWGDVSDPVWEFTTNNIQTLAAHWYIVDGAHTVLMPVAPADGASVRFASPVEWSTRGATFTAAGATTVGVGQTGMFAGYDVIEMTYSATADNWVVHVGGSGGATLYAADGTLGAPRAVTMAGNGLTFVGSGGSDTVITDGAVNSARAWFPEYFTIGTYVTATPIIPNGIDGSAQELIIDNTSTGDVNISTINSVSPGWQISLTIDNNDVIARNVVFASTYKDITGAALGTVSVAAGVERVFTFTNDGVGNQHLTGSLNASGADTVQNINATGTVTAWGSVVVIGATAPTANMVLTLPTAAGNTGKTIKLVRVDNTAFTVTLAAQVGETVTLLSTGTELNTQHGSLTVEATTATEIRQVAQVSAGSAAAVASFMRGSRSSGQSVASHNAVVFTTVDASAGTDISLNTTTGHITLKAGKTYRLVGSVVSSITSAQRTQWRWLNVTAGGIGFGAAQVFYSPADTAANSASGSPATAIISPSVDTVVLLQNTSLLTSDAGGNPDFGGVSPSVHPWFEVEVIGGQESAVVVPATPLHWAQLRRNDSFQGNPSDWAVGTRVGSGTTAWPTVEGSGAVGNANGTITLAQAGRYLVEAQINDFDSGASTGLTWQLRSNGTALHTTTFETVTGADPFYPMSVVADLPAGAVLDVFPLIAGVGAGTKRLGSGSFFRATQLPSATVVDPGLITPTPLSYASFNTPDANTAANTNAVWTTARIIRGTKISGATGQANIVLQPGLYKFTWGADDFEAGASNALMNVWDVGTNTTLFTRRATGWGGASNTDGSGSASEIWEITAATTVALRCTAICEDLWLVIEELPNSTVVDPGAVTVNDQAASGFMDVGGMRMQWGQLTNTNDSAQLVTLPAAFASTAYSISLTPDDGWSVGAGEVTPWKWSGKTTTSFNVDRDDDVSGTALVDWIAIGRKP